jgi:hypothetical protein
MRSLRSNWFATRLTTITDASAKARARAPDNNMAAFTHCANNSADPATSNICP